MTEPERSRQNGIDRRSMLRGAAWCVPVVAVAIASPAQAASGDVVSVVVTLGPISGTLRTLTVTAVKNGTPVSDATMQIQYYYYDEVCYLLGGPRPLTDGSARPAVRPIPRLRHHRRCQARQRPRRQRLTDGVQSDPSRDEAVAGLQGSRSSQMGIFDDLRSRDALAGPPTC